VDVVPKCWITDDGGCLWPSASEAGKQNKHMKKLVKNKQAPMSDWTRSQVKKIIGE